MYNKEIPQIPATEELNPATRAIRMIAQEFAWAAEHAMGTITLDDEKAFVCYQTDVHKIELGLRAMHNSAVARSKEPR